VEKKEVLAKKINLKSVAAIHLILEILLERRQKPL